MSKKKLRFAALIRVSTEKQADRGESLRTQEMQTIDAVAHHGGIITKEYAGQEHATPDHERKLLHSLLEDAQKTRKPFDAVIVVDESRWSRDNELSKKGLRILRENGIRFFTCAMEHDLHNPATCLWLGMSVEIGEFQAATQKLKSIENRINRAKRGLPTCGKLPFGRTFDKRLEKWGIDPTKKAMMRDVAKRYLNGESLKALAEEYGVNHTSLHKTLTKRCGDTWTVTFQPQGLNIDESVETPIPPLLPKQTIRAVLRKVAANKTYTHGVSKYPYLFSRMVFCEACGYAMFGQTNHKKTGYYRHAHTRRVKECKCPKTWVRADELESVVMRHLFECFGNPAAVKRAVEEATPNMDKVIEHRHRSERLDDQLKKIDTARNRILRLISSDTITDAQADKELTSLRDKEARQRAELDQLTEHLDSVPTQESIKTISKSIAASFQKRFTSAKLVAKKMRANQVFDVMTWDEKRSLVETVFAGKMLDGRRMGIYIEWLEDKRWTYSVHGHLIDVDPQLPMSPSRLDTVFGRSDGKADVEGAVTNCAWR